MTEAPAADPKPWRRLPRWVWITVIGTFVLAVIVAVSLALFLRAGAKRLEDARAVIRSRGEPVHVADIPLPQGPDSADLDERLQRFKRICGESPVGEFRIEDLADADRVDAVRAYAPAAAALSQIDAFSECSRAEIHAPEDKDSFFTRIWRKLDDPVLAMQLTDCERTALRALQLVNEPLVSEAELVCGARGDEGAFWVHDTKSEMLELWTRPMPILWSTHTLTSTVPGLALDQRADEALRRLTLALNGAQRIRGVPWVLAHLEWLLVTSIPIDFLARILPQIPAGTDLSAFENELDALDPHANLQRAWLGERACLNDYFDALDGKISDAIGPRSPRITELPLLAWRSYDHAFCLETLAGFIGCARQPLPEALVTYPTSTTAGEQFPHWATLSIMLVAKFDGTLRSTARLEAEIQLARAAIRAFKSGAESGAALAEESIDPFDGKPLRTRIESDGTLVVWSIGVDGVDDHAPPVDLSPGAPEPPDLVWRVKPR